MSKLSELTGCFEELQRYETVYTEEDIMRVLQELKLDQYETISDVPSRVVNEILQEITGCKCRRLDPNQEQEMLDYFESILVGGKIELQMIAKSLRYVLRKDTSKKTALLVVDVQNGFISGGLALRNAPAGQEGEDVVNVINTILEEHSFDVVVYSHDWHPADHCSFLSNVSKQKLHSSTECTAGDAHMYSKVILDGEKPIEQVLWPDHCVQGTEDAELHSDLNVVDNCVKIYKGLQKHIDSYSAFWDNGRLSRTDLLEQLFDRDITTVFACGLAYDFCVGFTCIDSTEHGFQTYVIRDATRGVNEESIGNMEKSLKKVGAIEIVKTDELDRLMA